MVDSINTKMPQMTKEEIVKVLNCKGDNAQVGTEITVEDIKNCLNIDSAEAENKHKELQTKHYINYELSTDLKKQSIYRITELGHNFYAENA